MGHRVGRSEVGVVQASIERSPGFGAGRQAVLRGGEEMSGGIGANGRLGRIVVAEGGNGTLRRRGGAEFEVTEFYGLSSTHDKRDGQQADYEYSLAHHRKLLMKWIPCVIRAAGGFNARTFGALNQERRVSMGICKRRPRRPAQGGNFPAEAVSRSWRRVGCRGRKLGCRNFLQDSSGKGTAFRGCGKKLRFWVARRPSAALRAGFSALRQGPV